MTRAVWIVFKGEEDVVEDWGRGEIIDGSASDGDVSIERVAAVVEGSRENILKVDIGSSVDGEDVMSIFGSRRGRSRCSELSSV